MDETSEVINVVVSSTFVAEPLQEALETWLSELRIGRLSCSLLTIRFSSNCSTLPVHLQRISVD